jgi:hypothetical protein
LEPRLAPTVAPNLIANGNFESVDLSNEQGNLDGWQTASVVNSRGGWAIQTGTQSPLSQTTVPAPGPATTNYQAMLDQPNLIPLPPKLNGVSQVNPNPTSSYSGSNFLYQSFIVPNNVYNPPPGATMGTLNLSLDLFINPEGTTFTSDPSLDYRPLTTANFQVRIDILDASDPAGVTDANAATSGQNANPFILATIFQSSTNTMLTNGVYQATIPVDLTSALTKFAGKAVILRIAGVTNEGPLIVGVDNVSVTAQYSDAATPSTTLQLRNPGFQATVGGPFATTDPTVIGKVTAADGGVNNIAYVAFDTANDGNFNGPNVFKTALFDANGDYSLTLPNLPFGQVTLGVRVADKAGNHADSTFTFIYQGPSVTNWQPVGPGPINVSSVPGIAFPTVTGMVTSVASDPSDPSGQTYLIGAANGGIWKTQDGGNNWTPVTDGLTNASGNLLSLPIGGIAYAPSNPLIVYAATGDGYTFPNAQPGDGVLKSTNGGASWSLVGNSGTVLAGARVTKVVVNSNDPNTVYVAVAAGGQFGPGLYRSTDGGATWANVLTAASMGQAPGTAIASATDVIIDPANPTDVIVGLGNIGLAPISPTGGVWISSDLGASWQAVKGGNNASIPNNTLPSGTGVGRVTLAEAPGPTPNIATYYVLIANPTTATPATGGSVNYGSFSGLFKSSDGGLNFTKVLLTQFDPTTAKFVPIDLLANDAGNVGSLAIDPLDPNVVYVGGSVQDYTHTYNPLAHGLIRVDTGDMRDAGYIDPTTNKRPNDGDDIQKVLFSEVNSLTNLVEGVSWYDLAENIVDKAPPPNPNALQAAPLAPGSRLPSYVTSLAVDKQGRLVIGSEDGVWRAVYHGVGYDYSGGGSGLLNTPTSKASVSITTINGNLQIAQLTSVAADPLVPNRFYTTQLGSGSAVTSGGLTWNTSGLSGPADVLGGPDGDKVVAAQPDPTAPPGTLATSYMIFAFNAKNTPPNFMTEFQVQSSNQAGAFGTYANLPTAGLSVNDAAGYFPVLNIYAQKIHDLVSGKFLDELLLGTDRIYTTRTGSALWDDKVGHALSAGAVVTAATFAQTTDNVIFAATSDGKLWANYNALGENAGQPSIWVEIDSGLPKGGTITSIIVDASNTQVAYITLNGAGAGHVFKTINGGSSWTNITANLGNLNAYALVQDPRSQPQSGAPNGRIYVGTQTGVFVTVDGGASWQRLGVGFPNAQVTSLQFNASLEELVAGTLGRGAFLISTDRVGPRVIAVSPATPVNPLLGSLSSVTVTFNEAISSFPLSQVISITGPSGAIAPVFVTDVSVATPGMANPHNMFKITFAAQSGDGVYTFQIGPNILDVVGNPMDQNQNGINGENPGDIFTFSVVLNSTDDGQFVAGLYRDLLNRPADTVGFETILAPVDAARFGLLPQFAAAYVQQLGAPQLVSDLYSSSPAGPPFSILGIGNLYPRAANSSDLAYWMGLLQNGLSFEQIIVSVTADIGYFLQNRAGHPVNGMDPAFVTQLYEDLFHRAPDAFKETPLFVNQLLNAELTARTQDARTLLAGQTYQTQFITNTYEQFFHRGPSTTGPGNELDLWLSLFNSGTTQEQMIATLLGSPEYFNSDAPGQIPGGATPSIVTWIRAVYQQLFPNYTITQFDLDHWFDILNSGALNYTQVALILDTSSLYRFGANGLVDKAYVQFMGRHAVQSDLSYWMTVYAANPNFRTEDLYAALVGSVENFQRISTANTPLPSQDAEWAKALYDSVLGPGAGQNDASVEQSVDLPFLAQAEFNARAAVTSTMVSSGEYRNDVTTSVYMQDLGRKPKDFELSLWQPVVGQGASPGGLNGDELLLQAVLGSQEYFMRQSDPADNNLHTNNSWLTSLYSTLRVPFDSAGEAANLANLDAAYAQARLNAIHAFTNGAEYQTVFITAQYNKFIGRPPAPSEVSFWLRAFQTGTTQEQLIASLMGSSLYFARTPVILGVSQNPSNDTFVRAAYLQLFPNYTVSQGEVDFWTSRLSAGTFTPQQVAMSLVTSSLYRFGLASTTPPYVNGVISRFYQAFDGRPAAPVEINFWMGLYASNPNFRTEEVIATILDAQEYLQRVRPIP